MKPLTIGARLPSSQMICKLLYRLCGVTVVAACGGLGLDLMLSGLSAREPPSQRGILAAAPASVSKKRKSGAKIGRQGKPTGSDGRENGGTELSLLQFVSGS